MSQDVTKDRLIEAAGKEFAAIGFKGATIRSISEKAGTNVAAVNYHFGDKEGLYAAAVIEAHRCGLEETNEAAETDIRPEEIIRRFVHRLLSHLFLDRDGSWQTALTLREMIEPTKASDALVRESIRPRFDRLRAALQVLCPEADERDLNAATFSVVGQCLHYKVARPISIRLIGEEAYSELDVEYLTDHITMFCLAAIGVVAPWSGVSKVSASKESD